MQVELARRRRRRTLLPSAAASRQTPSPTCIHTDRTTKYALRVLGRALAKRICVSPSYPTLGSLYIAILAVSSADAQLSLSLGQHNTDQADVVRGLIKISAHISIYYISRAEFCSANNTIYPPHPYPSFSAFSAEVQYLT